MNYYEPKYLYGVLKNIQPVNAYFRSNFFKDTLTFPTEKVDFEYMRGKRTLAPYSNGLTPAPVVGRTGYQLRTYTPPILMGSRIITPETLNYKLAGENPYSGKSLDERAQEIAASDLEELQASIQRREEFMCARLKQDGKITIDGDDVSGVVEYGFSNIEVTQTADKWTNTYDIIGKLSEKTAELLKCGTNADMLILGRMAALAFVENSKVAKMMRLRQELLIEELPKKLSAGVQYLGKLATVGLYLDVYCYVDFYHDEDHGTVLPYLDTDCAILQSSQERNYMLFGAVPYIGDDGEYVAGMGEYIPYVVNSQDPPIRKLIVASRPLPMPRDPDSWYVLKEVC